MHKNAAIGSITKFGLLEQALDYGLSQLLEFIWPTRCIGCEKHGQLLCSDCVARLVCIDASSACSRCGAPYGVIICTECYSRTGLVPLNFSAAVCALVFDALSARLIVCYKDQGERRLAQFLAACLAAVIPEQWLTWADALTFIPSSRAAFRRRGFEHIGEIAHQLSAILKVPLVCQLEKLPTNDQRGLGRQERYRNQEKAFRVSRPAHRDALPRRLLLIDDVLTTGATLNAASAALLAAGTEEVRVATVLRVY